MSNNVKGSVKFIQAVTDIEYECPICGEMICQELQEFLDEQGLSWNDFPDWEYDLKLVCASCGDEFNADDIFFE